MTIDARFLLLDDVVEVLEPVGAAEQGRDADDRQAVHVDRHLRARGSSRSVPASVTGAPPIWKKPKDSNELPVLEERLHDLPVRRLLVVPVLGVGAPEHDQPVDVLEARARSGRPLFTTLYIVVVAPTPRPSERPATTTMVGWRLQSRRA